MWNKIKNYFSFDVRALALYRVCLGFAILGDLAMRMCDLKDHYSDGAIFSRIDFLKMAFPWTMSLHFANGQLWFQTLLFSIHILITFSFIFGYKTRLSTILLWIFTVSVHNRMWLINNGGDDVLRAILFMSIFLPLGRVFSIDRAMIVEKKPVQKRHYSFWNFILFFQFFAIYFFSYILKNHPIWRQDYTAMFFAGNLDIFTAKLGYFIRQFPGLLKFMTIYAIYLEYVVPLIFLFGFLIPKKDHWAKTISAFLFITFHIGITSCMNIGLFPYYCMSMWCMVIPTEVWDWIEEKFINRSNSIEIYFDQNCGVCKKFVFSLDTFFVLKRAQLKFAQDNQSVYEQMQKHHSWVVLDENGGHHFGFDAFLVVLKSSPLVRPLYPVFSLNFFKMIGELFYRVISKRRDLLSHFTQFICWQEEKKPVLIWLREVLAYFIFIVVLSWNFASLPFVKSRWTFFYETGRYLHLYQAWNMFSPFPKRDNIWFEVPAELEDGTVVELLTGERDIYSSKNLSFVRSIKNEHWRKFYLNLSEKHEYAENFSHYLCRKWNDWGEGVIPKVRVKKFVVNYYSQMMNNDLQKDAPVKKEIWKHWCSDQAYLEDHRTNENNDKK